MHPMDQVNISAPLRAPPGLRWSHLAVAVHCPRRLLRDALVAWLDRAAFRVVGQVADVAALPHVCGLRRPDLVIVDAGEDVPATLGPLEDLRTRFSQTRVVVIYDELSPSDLAAAQHAGIDTLIPSSLGLESLFVVLHRNGTAARTGSDSGVAEEELTEQEREILALLGAGHPVRSIAALLNIALSAVENSKRRIYSKLRVASKSQAVAKAAGLGLVDPPEATVPPSGDGNGGLPELTARESDILRSIAMGHTVRQTARLLAIAEKTVENLQARLFLKLGTHNRAGAIGAAHALGLLDLGSDGAPRAAPFSTPPPRAARAGRHTLHQ